MFAGRTPSITLPDFFVVLRHFCCGGMTDAQSTTQRGEAKLQKWVQGLQWVAGVARGTNEQHMGLFVDTSQPEPSQKRLGYTLCIGQCYCHIIALIYVLYLSLENTLKKGAKTSKERLMSEA